LKLFEYEAKQAFSKYNIPVPNGILAETPEQAGQAAVKLKPPYVVKAQLLVGGRGKAGGIQTANSAQEAETVAGKLLGTTIKGFPVKQVLIEEKKSAHRELYLAVTVDRQNRCYVVLASEAGGVDIEETADQNPGSINKALIDPKLGLRSFHSAALAKQLGYSGDQLLALLGIIQKLYRVGLDFDAELAEINPLSETLSGEFVALDARITIDDNALFRHPEYAKRETQELTAQETSALKHNLSYVKLDGDIGVIGNGAGLLMATLDLLSIFGGKPADFLDLGGGAEPARITAAAKFVLLDPDTKAVLINVLGGITRCDDVAKGIVQAVSETGSKKPLVVRLIGTNEKEAKSILADAGISSYESMEEAARRAVAFVKGGL
jgi:succinyl-CoA synthetase beta subunit